jgi:hypothetical protein
MKNSAEIAWAVILEIEKCFLVTGCKIGAENVTDIVNGLELSFDKNII